MGISVAASKVNKLTVVNICFSICYKIVILCGHLRLCIYIVIRSKHAVLAAMPQLSEMCYKTLG